MSFEDPRDVPVEIDTISGDEDVNIQFTHEQPDIIVDSSSRFVEHEILGGTTVRQKVGENPDQVEISGVCIQSEANDIDKLKKTNFVELISHRRNLDSAQVVDTNTEPFEPGGAIDDKNQEMLYFFTIQLVEA